MTRLFSTFLGMAGIIAVLVSCDTLEPDLQKPTAELTGKEVHGRAESSTIIDLNSKIQTNQKVTLSVTRQTTRGTLTNLGKGLLQYSPNKGTRRDSFAFTLFGEKNEVLKEDSVVIILEPDSTNLPCGIYPADDYVLLNNSDSVSLDSALWIDVLANDMICGYTRSELEVTIYQPESGFFPPFYGSASVINNAVVYTPNTSTFTGYDKIIYSIRVKNDTTVSAFSVVYIQALTSCNFRLQDDNYTIAQDTTSLPALLSVFNNDALCDSSYRYDVVLSQGGTSTIDYRGIYYTPDSLGVGEERWDTLKYVVCYGDECRRATVIVNNKN